MSHVLSCLLRCDSAVPVFSSSHVILMLQPWRLLRHAPSATNGQTRSIADARPFAPGDLALLRPTNSRSAAPLLTKPLTPGHRIDTHRGGLLHADIIGKRVRDVVRTSAGRLPSAEYRLHEVKLEEYVRYVRRLVTPLYPQDAQVIVALMDLHPEGPSWSGDRGPEEGQRLERLEILEAGTGHGALTLYLSRAIHAANRPFPRHGKETVEEEDHVAIDAWKASRRAVIHTVEVSPRYSAHAQKIVTGFRHGMYAHNVDFHVGNVSEWTSSTLAHRGGAPFLSHAFLDLPGTEDHLPAVSSALRTDSTLIVFCPSITQIMACLSTAKADGLPLELETVIELGVNGGTGGREWDVRAVKPRAAVKAAAAAEAREDSGVEVSEGEGDSVVAQKTQSNDDGWKMVCRPKVGELVVGGGFLGVFRKQRIFCKGSEDLD